jgi:hypothetical protein
MATLIKSCWQTEPSTRPNIKIILNILENLDSWKLFCYNYIIKLFFYSNIENME